MSADATLDPPGCCCGLGLAGHLHPQERHGYDRGLVVLVVLVVVLVIGGIRAEEGVEGVEGIRGG